MLTSQDQAKMECGSQHADAGHGMASSANSYGPADDRSSLIVPNHSANGSPARASNQTRSGTVSGGAAPADPARITLPEQYALPN
jgi:hypothetical protein